MEDSFKNINFPSKYKYSSDSEHIPLEFYNDTFPVAKKNDFSSVTKNKLLLIEN